MAQFHGVRFYESTASMAATAAVFLGAGLIVDESVLVIARRAHRAAIERALRDISFSLAALKASQRLHMLDAEHTVRVLAPSGAVDPRRFATVLAELIGRLSTERPVRVYDEMTDLLCHHGQRGAALQLEASWDRLTLRGGCSVLCGHSPTRRRPQPALHSMCSCHTHVIASDGTPHPISRVRAAIALREPGESRSVH